MYLTQKDKLYLSVKNLSIKYQQKYLLQNISFELYQGEILAIVGESGSGKTLTALAILGLLSYQFKQSQMNISGDIYFYDIENQQKVNIISLTEQQKQNIRGKKIAMIFQEPMTALNPLHTVKKLIGENLYLSGWSKNKVIEKVLILLSDVGIEQPQDILDYYPHQLSGGQRQRVMIAMALSLNPQIIIADEPTTALDLLLKIKILSLLKSLQHKYNLSIILISHDLKLIKEYAHNILILKNGEIYKEGNIDSIFLQQKYQYIKELLHTDLYSKNLLNYQQKKQLLPCLEIKDLFVQYPRKKSLFFWQTKYSTILKSLSFSLKKGETIGVIGESGCGKTSLALAIMRLIDSQGEMKLYFNDSLLASNNKDANEDLDHLEYLDLNQYRENKLRLYRHYFQMVFQDPFSSLNPRMSILQIIGHGLYSQGLEKNKIRQRVIQLLIQVGLSADYCDHYPHQLSGGQRQRVALARALVLEPKLLILDEVTSALDRKTQLDIIQLLIDIQQQQGTSYLFIAHDLSVVRLLCHRVMVLRHGEIIEFQPTEDLFHSPCHDYTKALIQASI